MYKFVVPNQILVIEKDSEIILTPKSTKIYNALSVRRVVEIFVFIKEIQNSYFDHGPFGCSFKDMIIIPERRLRVQSTISFMC